MQRHEIILTKSSMMHIIVKTCNNTYNNPMLHIIVKTCNSTYKNPMLHIIVNNINCKDM